MGKPFVINRHGRLVFPSNFLGDLDFSVIDDRGAALGRRAAGLRGEGADRDARSSPKTESGGYASRFELLRDLALNLFWANRYAMTMYEKRPTRWRDVPAPPRRRLPADPHAVAGRRAQGRGVAELLRGPARAAWDGEAEDRIHEVLFDVFRHKLHHATELSAIKPTVAEVLADPGSLTFCLSSYDPDYPVYGYDEILDCSEERAGARGADADGHGAAQPVPVEPSRRCGSRRSARSPTTSSWWCSTPRNREVRSSSGAAEAAAAPATATPTPPARAVRPRRRSRRSSSPERYAVKPRIEALAVVKGERVCTNEDLIRNTAYSWSPMTRGGHPREDRHRVADLHRARPRRAGAGRRHARPSRAPGAGPRRSARSSSARARARG